MKFGNTIQLFAPLYISNECENSCLYCGFNAANNIKRMTLDDDEVLKEAEIIHSRGFRHILLLTGESRKTVPVQRIASTGKMLHGKFASISIEVYPMETGEYRLMAVSGIDGLTLYQETYNRDVYAAVHPAGKKKDFAWRLNAPDRGGTAGFRKLGIGALLGLADWRVDGFFTALHAMYLAKKYWRSFIQISFPRIREAPGSFVPEHTLSDRDLTHLICAMRIILPEAGFTLSTRESPLFRDNIIPLGITVMSAGSKTNPGGYSGTKISDGQFCTADTRSPIEIAAVLRNKGFDPVWKDWDRNFCC